MRFQSMKDCFQLIVHTLFQPSASVDIHLNYNENILKNLLKDAPDAYPMFAPDS